MPRTGPLASAATLPKSKMHPRRRCTEPVSVERVDGGPPDGTTEGDEPIAVQDEAPHVPVLPVLGIFEAEAALEAEPPGLPAAQSQAARGHLSRSSLTRWRAGSCLPLSA